MKCEFLFSSVWLFTPKIKAELKYFRTIVYKKLVRINLDFNWEMSTFWCLFNFVQRCHFFQLPDWFAMIWPHKRTVSKVDPHFPTKPFSNNLHCWQIGHTRTSKFGYAFTTALVLNEVCFVWGLVEDYVTLSHSLWSQPTENLLIGIYCAD